LELSRFEKLLDKDIKKSFKPEVMLLVETKNVDSVVNSLAKDLGYKNSFVVSASGSSGGAAFFLG